MAGCSERWSYRLDRRLPQPQQVPPTRDGRRRAFAADQGSYCLQVRAADVVECAARNVASVSSERGLSNRLRACGARDDISD